MDIEEDQTRAFRARGHVLPLVRGGRERPPGVAQIEAYWHALRAGRLVPQRSEIDPRGIEGALDRAFIVERIAPGIARFRLAGGHLCAIAGTEVRGMPLSALFAPEARRELAEAVEGTFTGPETLRLRLESEAGLARPALEAELVLLPLRSDLGDVTRALGCLSCTGEPGRGSRRFSIAAAWRTPLSGGPAIAPAPARAPISAPLHAAGFAEAQAPLARAPHLRLVKSDGPSR